MLREAVVTLHWASTLAQMLVVAHLFKTGIARRVPFFCAAMAFDGISSVPLATLSITSPLYAALWGWKQPFLMIIMVLSAYECCRNLAESYKSFHRIGRGLAVACAFSGVAVGLAGTLPELLHPRFRSIWHFVYVARRGVGLGIVAAMLLATLLFAVIPAPARRNSIIHAQIYAVYEVADAVAFYSPGGILGMWSQLGLLATYLACFVCWIRFLEVKGEYLPEIRYVSRDEADAAKSEVQRAVNELFRR